MNGHVIFKTGSKYITEKYSSVLSKTSYYIAQIYPELMKNGSMILTPYYSFFQMGHLFIDQIPQQEEKACQKSHIVSVHHPH